MISEIWFKASFINKKKISKFNKYFPEYYVPSKIAKGNGQIKTCSHHDYPNIGEVCEVEVRHWEDCNRDQFFNYHKNSPCIFLKLNKIYGWTPEYYDDPFDLPQEMPESLKERIRKINNTREVRIFLSYFTEHLENPFRDL